MAYGEQDGEGMVCDGAEGMILWREDWIEARSVGLKLGRRFQGD